MKFYVVTKTKNNYSIEQKKGDILFNNGNKVYGYRNSNRQYTIVDPMTGLKIGDVPSLNQMSKLDDKKFQEFCKDGVAYRAAVQELQNAIAEKLGGKHV